MVIIAGLILVGGYGLAYWGACLVRGKNVTLAQMFNPFGNYAQFSGPFSSWANIPDGQIFPGGGTDQKGGGKGKPAGAPRPPATKGPGAPAGAK